MPLSGDSPVLGVGPPGVYPTQRAMVFTFNQELFDQLKAAVVAEQTSPAAGAPAVQIDFSKPLGGLNKSPGSLYIGGQELRIQAVRQNIYDLYSQSRTPSATKANQNPPLRPRAPIIASCTVPLPSTKGVEKLHAQAAAQEHERQKRGVVMIDEPPPAAQSGKKRKAAGADQGPAARSASATTARNASGPRGAPAVQTLRSVIDASSIKKELAASGGGNGNPNPGTLATTRTNGRTQHAHSSSTGASPDASSQPQSQPNALTPGGGSVKPLSAASSTATTAASPIKAATPAAPSPASTTPVPPLPADRTPADGWKTSDFRGGIREKPQANAKSKTKASGANPKKAKSAPGISDEMDDDASGSSGSAGRKAVAGAGKVGVKVKGTSGVASSVASPVPVPSPIGGPGAKAGRASVNGAVASPRPSASTSVPTPPPARASLKRARDSDDAELLAAADSGSGSGAGPSSTKRRTLPNAYPSLDSELEAAVTSAPTSIKVKRASAAAVAGSAEAPSKKSAARLATSFSVDDALLETLPEPSSRTKPAGAKASASGAAGAVPKPRVPKVNYDDEEFGARKERKAVKKTPGAAAAGRASLDAAGATASKSTTNGATTTAVKGRKSVGSSLATSVQRERERDDTPVRTASATAAAANGATKPPRASLPNGRAASPAMTNGSSSTATTATERRNKRPTPLAGSTVGTSTSSQKTNGGATAGKSTLPSSSGAGGPAGSRYRKRTTADYTSSEDDVPPPKPIPPVPRKRKLDDTATATATGASTSKTPPSPVSLTSSKKKAIPITTPPPPPSKRRRYEIADSETDSLLATSLPPPGERDALREHYDECYPIYIALWGRMRAERLRQKKLLLEAEARGAAEGEPSDGEIEEGEEEEEEENDKKDAEEGEEVQSLLGRYSRMHERLQTIRATMGA
ncbi:hypothetical protein DL93DRAFT_1204903 [Clavulina sp. PMI_390]|nr:hypothetical protein DL93DRAFT_1204903 [Clavulina sp. PMI_390]